MTCSTTHHNACDCREAHFATIATEREHWFSVANRRALELDTLRRERDALAELVGAAYQIVGILADHAGLSGHPSVVRALDALSNQRETEPLLPWPHEPLPDMAERDAPAALLVNVAATVTQDEYGFWCFELGDPEELLSDICAAVGVDAVDAARKALGEG